MGCLFSLFSSCLKSKKCTYLSIDEEDDIIDDKVIKIHICGKIDLLIVNQIFPDTCKKKLKGKNFGDLQWETNQFSWIAKLYKEKANEKAFENIFKEIQNNSDLEQNSIKNHIILSFGDDDHEKLFEQLYKVGIVYLPRFIFITQNEGNYSLKKKSYISNIIRTDLTDIELITHIKSEIWEIDCYYNERGNETCTFLPNKLVENIEIPDISINILLTGISRSGKSTFINIVNNSLLSLENCEKSSVTSKITEYKIYGPNKSEKDGFLKFIDTAGFNCQTNKKNDNKELYNLTEINKSISNLIEIYKKKTPFENIHFVLFFFLEGSSLEGTETVLKMFLKENYKVLFIINKSINTEDNGEPTDIKSTLKFLNNKGLKNLANKKNIINCNIIDSKRIKGYGINTIFKRIFEILKENNSFYNDEKLIIKLKKCIENINQTFNVKGKEKELLKYKNESTEIKENITKNNELFKEFAGDEKAINNLKNKANFDKKIYIALTVSQAFIPIPYSDLYFTPLCQAKMIHTILTDFGISFTEILTEIDLKKLAESLVVKGGLREISHIGYNKASKQIFEKTAKGCMMQLGKYLGEALMANQGAKTVAETMKYIPFLGFIVGSSIGLALNFYSTQTIADNSIIFSEKYIREKDFLGFFLKHFEIFNNLFKDIESLGKKENWWDYKMKIIKKK